MVAILLSGYEARSEKVEFIIPDGFHGIFQLSPDSNAPPIPFTNGCFIVEIPKSGKLLVKDTAPFKEWHKPSARYRSGKPIKIGITANDGNEIFCFSLFSDSDGNQFALIGTSDEYRMAQRISPFEIPIARPITTNDLPKYGTDK